MEPRLVYTQSRTRIRICPVQGVEELQSGTCLDIPDDENSDDESYMHENDDEVVQSQVICVHIFLYIYL